MKKVAVITGCNRGAGEGIRNQLLKAGYHVYGINRTSTKDVEKIDSYTEYICDVSNAEKVKEVCENIKESINLLVLNAGIRKFGKISELSIEDFSYSVDVNLKGPFYVVTYLLEHVKEWKIKPEEIGNAILNLVDMPENLLLSDINLRPQSPKQLEIEGIELMQYK